MPHTFAGVTVLADDISKWDISIVPDMTRMLDWATELDADISK